VLWAPVRQRSGAGRSTQTRERARSSLMGAVRATPTTSKAFKTARRRACLWRSIAAVRDITAAGITVRRMVLTTLCPVNSRAHAAVASAHWCVLCAEALSMHAVQAFHYCDMSVHAAEMVIAVKSARTFAQ
jgi:hypothetical protein